MKASHLLNIILAIALAIVSMKYVSSGNNSKPENEGSDQIWGNDRPSITVYVAQNRHTHQPDCPHPEKKRKELKKIM